MAKIINSKNIKVKKIIAEVCRIISKMSKGYVGQTTQFDPFVDPILPKKDKK